MPNFFNVFDVVVGVVSLGGTVTALLVYLYQQLPSKKIIKLMKLIDDTTSELNSCAERGLLSHSSKTEFGTQLSRLRVAAEIVEVHTKCTTTLWEDVVKLCNGLGYKIYELYSGVQALNADIYRESRETLDSEVRQRAAPASAVNVASAVDATDNHLQPPSGGTEPGQEVEVSSQATESAAAACDATALHRTSLAATGGDKNTPAVERVGSQLDLRCAASQEPADLASFALDPRTSSTPLPRIATQRLPSDGTVSALDVLRTRTVPSLKRSTPFSCARAVVRGVRHSRKRRSLHSQTSATINLLDLSAIELVDESDDEWEDVMLGNEALLAVA